MAGLSRRIVADKRGGALLEFVAASMLLLIIWTGMCNAALILKDRLAVAAVAREAGREAAASGNNHRGVIRGQEIARMSGIESRSEIKVYSAGYPYIASEVSCRIPLAFPGMGTLFGGSPWDKEVTVRTKKTFRLEP